MDKPQFLDRLEFDPSRTLSLIDHAGNLRNVALERGSVAMIRTGITGDLTAEEIRSFGLDARSLFLEIDHRGKFTEELSKLDAEIEAIAKEIEGKTVEVVG